MSMTFLSALTIGLAFLGLSGPAAASENCKTAVGKFASLEGTIELGHADQGDWLPASLDSSLCQNDTIHVGENSRATVSLINDVILRLDQNTTMQLADVAPQPEKRSLLNLIAGAFKSFSRPPRFLAVNTPYVNGLIEGTEFAMRIDGDSTLVTVYEGKVRAQNEKGELSLTRGKSALAKAGKAPEPYILVNPRNAVQWTLHFPPLFAALGGGGGQTTANLAPALKNALDLAAAGDMPGALALMKQPPAAEQDAAYHLNRAALYLNTGRVDEANADIDAALQQDPQAGLAYALRAVIEVVNNEHEQALVNAEKAVALSPTAAAKMALAYAQQSAFRLEDARDTLISATQEHPDDPLAWARLGEMWLMFGERGKALEAAHKAEALAPNLARTQDVLGFAALAENRDSAARTAFAKAIALNSADPLAHFGLGLGKIKGGDLQAGRKDIEAAVALDSSNALLRSYLGKAYYEEKRFPLEGHQYEIAKELDPADPTPYFYDAIDKQTTNRPVEALQSMEKAIELNDSRAVYRSRMQLDSDLAARSASMARVYSDLGFQQRALVEGWKSVNTDPSNFSAHRFLSDSYSVLPRHEIARVSELLQSQLLQPLNMTPIQPHLAESNLFLLSAGGPGSIGFNEFNPIFNRDGLTFQTSGLAGERNTYAGEGVLSGIFRSSAFSLGGFHSSSDGFRKNEDFRNDVGNAYFQYEFSPQTSVQAEYRYRTLETGDLQQRFFQDNFRPNLRYDKEWHTYRLGARHNFSERSTLLGSFIYQEFDGSLKDSPFPGAQLSNVEPNTSLNLELQQLFRSEYVNFTVGMGHLAINGIEQFSFLPFVQTVQNGNDLDHTNAYLYSYVTPIKKLTITLGVSGDFTGGERPEIAGINQIHPKIGLMWEPVAGTLFRAAAFRSLKRTLITNQTIEPTQVAGFNQFYDDPNGTKAWRYGAAIDQKFSSTLFGGIELSRRDLDVPTYNDTIRDAEWFQWRENLARSYLFWAPTSWLAFKTEYQFERTKRDQGLSDGVEKMDTHRIPIGVNVFHPFGSNGAGMSGSLSATYVNQEGRFTRIRTFETEPGHDDFWTIDASVNLRLPKRYGFITVGASNLLDEEFNYYDLDVNTPRLHPGRMLFGKITLAIP